MKKVLIVVAVLFVIVGVLVFFLASNLDAIVKAAIEKVGSDALGVDVSVGSVSLDLANGTGSILDLSIANPPGYSRDPALAFGELTLALSKERISLIRLAESEINVEGREETSNLSDLLAGMSDEAPAESESEVVDESGEPVVLTIDRIEIEAAQATVTQEGEEPLEVAIQQLVFTDLQGTSEEITRQVLQQLLQSIVGATKQALRGAVEDAVEEKVDEAKEGLRGKLRESLGGDKDDG